MIVSLARKASKKPLVFDLRVRTLWHDGQRNGMTDFSRMNVHEESREPSQPGLFDFSKSLVSLLSSHVYNRG